MSDKPPLRENVVAGSMATFPARFSFLRDCVASIGPQLDVLYIYVNETMDGCPNLSTFENVVVLDSRDYDGDLSANGKIHPLRFLKHSLVFTLDDDFIYPPDYVSRYTAVMEEFDHKCCVTTHGSIMNDNPDWYYERTNVFMSRRKLPKTQLVSLAGSGTFAFHQDTLPCTADDFLPQVMVDLRFSLLAHAAGLPIWCISRPDDWLTHIKSPGLFETFATGQITHHTGAARAHDWSFRNYRDLALKALEARDAKGTGAAAVFDIDPALETSIRNGTLPEKWKSTLVTQVKRASYLTILESL